MRSWRTHAYQAGLARPRKEGAHSAGPVAGAAPVAGAGAAGRSQDQSVRLVLWRHGQTQWNVDGRFQGQSDIPLDPVGEQQAERAARLLGLPEDLWGAVGPLANCAWSLLGRRRGRWRLLEHNAGTLPEPVLSDDR